MSKAPLQIKDCVKELRRVKASLLVPNPKNYRTHPERQRKLLSQLFGEIGYADALLAYELPDGRLQLIDGHLRAELTPDQEVPVLVLDVTEAQANKLILTLDPLAALAETDSKILDDLLKSTPTTGDLEAWLKERAEEAKLFDIDAGALPDLPSGDKTPFQSLTFTLSDRQAEAVKRAVEVAKGRGLDDCDNQSANGNALFAIVEAYLG
jgi:ParB-like chromosome segregation protein Spo0J